MTEGNLVLTVESAGQRRESLDSSVVTHKKNHEYKCSFSIAWSAFWRMMGEEKEDSVQWLNCRINVAIDLK